RPCATNSHGTFGTLPASTPASPIEASTETALPILRLGFMDWPPDNSSFRDGHKIGTNINSAATVDNPMKSRWVCWVPTQPIRKILDPIAPIIAPTVLAA